MALLEEHPETPVWGHLKPCSDSVGRCMCGAHACMQVNTHTHKIKMNQSFEKIVFETGFYVAQAKLKIVLQLMTCKDPEKRWVWALLKPG